MSAPGAIVMFPPESVHMMEPCPSPSWQQSLAWPATKVMRPDRVMSPAACRAQSLCGRTMVAGAPSAGPAIAQGQWLAGGHELSPHEPLWSSLCVIVSTDPAASADALQRSVTPPWSSARLCSAASSSTSNRGIATLSLLCALRAAFLLPSRRVGSYELPVGLRRT